MRPEFSTSVDPLFERVLHAIVQVESGTELDARDLHTQLLNLFDLADRRLGPTSQWTLAKYALAAWIDELMLGTPWAGADWWRDHILELHLFQTRLCHVRFFELARQSSAEPVRDALEVFVNCVQLGFRGMYGDGSMEKNHTGDFQTSWPPTLDAWLKEMEPRLDLTGRRRAAKLTAQFPQREISGAPPLPAGREIVWWSLAATVLVLVLMLVNGRAIQNMASTMIGDHSVTGK